MIQYEVHLKGIAPISFSRVIRTKKETGESADAFEERTWRERLHTNSQGEVILPPQMLKCCLEQVAIHLSESVPGKGSSKYTKHFKSGIMITEPGLITLNGKPIIADSVGSYEEFGSARGQRGRGPKVWKRFPIIQEWEVVMIMYLLDPILQSDSGKVEEYIKYAGQFIGLGKMRPASGGYFGRFTLTQFKKIGMVKVA